MFYSQIYANNATAGAPAEIWSMVRRFGAEEGVEGWPQFYGKKSNQAINKW